MSLLGKRIFWGWALLWGSFSGMPGEVGAGERVPIIGDYSPVNTLDPVGSTMSQHTTFCRNLFQGLVRYKYNSIELEGDLATRWTLSPDGLVYTFKLRQNIPWHKGFGKVTAHDVKFTFDRLMDPQTRSPFTGEVQQVVEEVKVIDDSTVEVHLKRRTVVFLHLCARPKPLGIVCQRAVEKYGKEFARNPIGSGPFVFQSMSREQIVLTANPEYWEGPPKIDKVVYKVIPDMDTLVMALQRGDVDFNNNVPREQATLERIKAAGCRIKVVDRGAWHMLLLNPQFKPFTDVRVRRAIAHAIDREAIIDHVLSGMAEKLDSPVPKGYFGHTQEGLRRYDFNPRKAKELLSEAGYANGFEVTFDTFNSPSYLPVATAIQGQLEKVGIKTKLDVTDQPSFMKKISAATSLMAVYLPVRSPDADIPLTNFFHSAGFAPGH